jgi:hypothetical protein
MPPIRAAGLSARARAFGFRRLAFRGGAADDEQLPLGQVPASAPARTGRCRHNVHLARRQCADWNPCDSVLHALGQEDDSAT